MRKSKLRKLKARFRQFYGRGPDGPVVKTIRVSDGAIGYLPSEIRRLKKGAIEL